MIAKDKSISMIGLSVGTAMAAALLSGCAGGPAPQAHVSASAAQQAQAKGKHDKAIAHAEAAVAADPNNAAYRTVLGSTYLDAGRFASAATSFEGAMALGDNSSRTALSLSLALIGQARYAEAAALLNDWEASIAPADLGLALALSGQPERGIHILTNQIRGGNNTVKARQNLAYAYAVAGRWREARVMASQDLPADQVGARMAEWAEMTHADAYQQRIADLLQVPSSVYDGGQPAHLALVTQPGMQQFASEAHASAASETELAAVESHPEEAPIVAMVEAAPASNMIAIPARASQLPGVGQPSLDISHGDSAAPAPGRADFARNFTAPVAASVKHDTKAFSATSGTQAAPARKAIAAAPTRASNAAVSADGSHLVQLGSFSSEQGARRAWGIYLRRHPELAGHEMVITEAVVSGKRYWRVSAGGFDMASSRSTCSNMRAGGESCISWAAATPLPGAVDTGRRFARR